MGYEKKYRDLVEAVKELQEANPHDEGIQKWIEANIPELKESEDERIRKEILTAFSCGHDNSDIYGYGITYGQVRAWLEKQGEQNLPLKEIILNVWELGNYWKDLTKGVCNTEHGTQLDYILKHWTEGEHYTKLLEKQGEQILANSVKTCKVDNADKVEPKDYNDIDPHFGKPIDKVEPKFKVGDWVTNGIETVQITGYDIDYGYQVDYKGNLQHRDTDIIEKEYHLWNIADAKDADVLVTSDGSIFLFAGVVDCACKYYVALTICNDAKINKEVDGGYWETSRAVHPATKEQRDLLFQKMHEAGYEWDAEKKEPKKIEQKPWSEEDETILSDIIKDLVRPWNEYIPDRIEEEIKWLKNKLKSLRPQSTWKPSERQLQSLEMAAKYYMSGKISKDYAGKDLSEILNELKKLKG